MIDDTKQFKVLVADPPWQFGDKLPGDGRGAEKNYDVLSIKQLLEFPIPKMLPDSWLFLWRVAAMPEEALQLVRAWGFVPKTELVWCKKTKTGKRWFGMGHQVRAEHETCLIATRGSPKVLNRKTRSTFDAAYTGHSRKPDEFYNLVESLCPGPFAELFGRRPRDGWRVFGNQMPNGCEDRSEIPTAFERARIAAPQTEQLDLPMCATPTDDPCALGHE